MDKDSFKKMLNKIGLNPAPFLEKIDILSIRSALREKKLNVLMERLQKIVPDITDQYSRKRTRSHAWKLKVRGLHAFQTSLMFKALQTSEGDSVTVVDIGDSAGTHMHYLKEIAQEKLKVETISVNLDPRAVEKIRSKGLKAILCRAEDIKMNGNGVDLFTSFEMIEHLHNPSLFFYRLAKKAQGNKLLITVPFLRKSRVGLHSIRNSRAEALFAEDEHIFELSPQDWTLLFRHSGWKLTYSDIYYQYPRKWPVISRLFKMYWRRRDFEGFWGALLEKDTTYADLYQDWEG